MKKKSIDPSKRPYIIIDLTSKNNINMIYLRIRNFGNFPAYKISFEIDREIKFSSTFSSKLELFKNGLYCLAPNDELSIFWNTAFVIFNEPKVDFNIKVTYYDLNNEQYSENFEININSLKDLSIALSSEDKLAEKVNDINKNFEKLHKKFDDIISIMNLINNNITKKSKQTKRPC